VGFLPPVLVYDGSGDFKYLWNTPQTYPLPESSPQRPRPIGLALNVERRAWWTVPKNLAKIGRVPNRVLRCPSDDALFDPPAVGVLLTIHVSGSGQGFTAVTGPANLGATSYTGVAGAAGWFVGTTPAAQRFGPWEGVLTNRSKVELGHFPKGGANTLLIGEGLGGTGVGGRDYTWSWIGVGALGTVYGLGRPTVPAAPAPPEYGETPPDGADGAAWYRFSSWHPHGVQFCFADCSVRGLRFGTTTQPDSADWQLLQLLAARQGPAVTPADLGE
jgi:hypothetical protein